MQKYHLTSTQQSIWITQCIDPDAVLYNVGGYATIHGMIEPGIFTQALHFFISQHDAFTLRFKNQGNGSYQFFDPSYTKAISFFDFSTVSKSDEHCIRFMKENFDKQFSLDEELLWETSLLKSANRFYWYVKLHHLISDGFSLSLLFNKVADIYTHLSEKNSIPVLSRTNSYALFLEKNKKYKDSSSFIADKIYWEERYKDVPEKPDFGTVKSSSGTTGLRIERIIPSETLTKINSFITKSNSTIYHFFIGVLYVFFSKLFQRELFVLGLPVFNRSDPASKQTIGTLINVIPFKFQNWQDLTVTELLSSIKKQLFNDYKHHNFTAFDQRESLNYHGNIYNIAFSYQKIHYQNKFHTNDVNIHYLKSRDQIEDIIIHLIEYNNNWDIKIVLDYKEDLIPDVSINNWLDTIFHILDLLPNQESEKVKNLTVIQDKDQDLLFNTFNATEKDYPSGKNIVELFQEQVNKCSYHKAVSQDKASITYKTLDILTNNFASWLQLKGIKQGAIIGIVAECSTTFVTAVLGILKSGAAFLPIDPQTPQDRIKYMVADSNMQLLLMQDKLLEKNGIINGNLSEMIVPISENYFYALDNIKPIQITTGSQDLAYVIYTSGTTGKPKGVMITHRNLINYTCFAALTYVKQEQINFPLFTSISFDLTITSIFTPLITGNTIVVYSGASNELVLEKIIDEKKVGIIKLTPSHLKLIRHKKYNDSSIKRLIVGGEELEVQLCHEIISNFNGSVEIINEYGPTETTVGCTIHQFNPKDDTSKFALIGKPISNTQVYILDKNLMPLPLGATGELFIAGQGVAKGYINNIQATKEKFLKNPFSDKDPILYKTGDQGRWLPHGILEFSGRIDEQIKLNGFRIELREIESALLSHPNITEAKVICRQDKDEKHICAYLVCHRTVDASELRTYLSHSLNHYMIPSHFIHMDKMPLTTNGKIDKDKLPAPKLKVSHSIKAARSLMEIKTLEVWKEVLKLDEMGIADNYYDMGGDSIKAIQIISRLSACGLSITVKDILTYQTIEQLALNGKLENTQMTYDQSIIAGEKTLVPIEKWFFAQQLKNPHHYNQSVLLEFKHDVQKEDIQAILSKLIEHHDALRINYDKEKEKIYFNNTHHHQPPIIEYHDLSRISGKKKSLKLIELGRRLKSSFDIYKSPLIRIALFKWNKNTTRILISIHHLATDGISWRILLEDFYNAYHGLKNNNEIILPLKTASLIEWTKKLRQQYPSSLLAGEKKYWTATEKTAFTLPVDLQSSDWRSKNRKKIKSDLTEADTAVLNREIHKKYRSDLSVVLLTALAMSINEWTNIRTIVVEMEHHGRHLNNMDVSRTMGWFTTLYPLKITISSASIHEQIAAVKETIHQVPGYGMGYASLKFDDNEIDRSNIRTELRFNYLGEFDSAANNDLFVLIDEDSGDEVADENEVSAKIELNGMLVNGKLLFELHYNKNMYNTETMTKLNKNILTHLMRIKTQLCNEEQVYFTPSDFDTIDMKQDDLETIFN